MGGVAMCATPSEAGAAAARMLGMMVGQFPVTHVLVEERLSIQRELFVSLSIDDKAHAPVILIANGGGSGIEERAASVMRIECDVIDGPSAASLTRAVDAMKLDPFSARKVTEAVLSIFRTARLFDARSIEVNPLVITSSGDVVAADCRITIDDYAVSRHPELGIQIARELDHPPTMLEKIAYECEQTDHRGTFYFAQMNTASAPGSRGLIGFHGAGGGGSMMSMDAITVEGFTIANFCDTSGNPSPAKVYRAARIILAQPGLSGYFGSGSGVANQEQYWSAYGLAKAFWELDLDIPAVIRLGGNTEDRAVEVLEQSCRAAGLKSKVEGFRKTDTVASIAARFAAHVRDADGHIWKPRAPRRPAFVGSSGSMQLPVKGGVVWIDPQVFAARSAAIIDRSSGLLRSENGVAVLTVSPEAFVMKDSEMIACEVECRRDGIGGVFVELDIPGLNHAPAEGRA
jgi:succinyl-CoA synthetase beta subunit